MQLQVDPEILEWFSSWSGEFDWDEGNTSKNENHGITRLQIESVFGSPIYVAGRITESLAASRHKLSKAEKKGGAIL